MGPRKLSSQISQRLALGKKKACVEEQERGAWPAGSMRGEGGWEPKRAPARLLVEWSTALGQADLGPGAISWPCGLKRAGWGLLELGLRSLQSKDNKGRP